MKTRIVLLTLLTAGVLTITIWAAGIEDGVQIDRLKAALYYLAGDEMRGRAADSEEAKAAAAYIRSRFESAQLKSGVEDGSFYQPLHLVNSRLGVENRMIVQVGLRSIELQPNLLEDFYPLRSSPSARVSGEIAFVGFGINAPGLSHNDYRSEAVAGRIALALDHEPGEKDEKSIFDGVVTSEASREERKTLAAQEAGAIALLIVSDVQNHDDGAFDAEARGYWPEEESRSRWVLADWADALRIPVLRISSRLAESLVSASGRSLEELARYAETPGGVDAVVVPETEAEFSVQVHQTRRIDRNVVAMLEGTDRADETVIVCAHYDHDGAIGSRIFNGADDDASGTVGVLEVAEAFAEAARNGMRPRRTVLFAVWNFEERGLLGAWGYTERPLRPLEKTVAVLNMDMIGRNEEVPEGGGRRFRGLEPQTAESNRNAVNIMGYSFNPQLQALIERLNSSVGLDLRFRYDNNPSNLLRRSDHWPFLQKGVPAVFFHTGLHPDYHTPDDRPEKINFPKMERIIRLISRTAWEAANGMERPAFARPLPYASVQ